MKWTGAKTFAVFALGLLASMVMSCTNATETSVVVASAATEATYDCTYFPDRYNDLSTCQNVTGATCSAETDSFPNGVSTTCYFPPTGFEACTVSVPTWNWIYTNSDWCDTGSADTSANEIYKQSRSLVGCSSTVCTCETTPVLTVYCAGPSAYTTQDPGAPTGTSGCGNYSPNPAATPDPSATPSPTPVTTPTPIPLCI